MNIKADIVYFKVVDNEYIIITDSKDDNGGGNQKRIGKDRADTCDQDGNGTCDRNLVSILNIRHHFPLPATHTRTVELSD